MTNFDRWKIYTEESPCPYNFVDGAWTFLISACLERRVWLASSEVVYPNQYHIFIAKPGVGKGITTVVKRMLQHFNRDGSVAALSSNIQDDGDGGQAKVGSSKLLFPVAATSTTYEKFVETLSRNLRIVPKTKPRYAHCSTAFVLDELSSIFKKDAEAMMSFLLEGWTCSESHDRETISRGVNFARNICINIIGGTQPDKIPEMRKANILSSGAGRRTIFNFGREARKRHFLRPEYTKEQLDHRDHILQHMLKLSKLCGPVAITPEALEFSNDYFSDEKTWRINVSPYLDDYYVSKNLHVIKIAMALHFGESEEMTIGVGPFQQAIKLLANWEKDMHIPFSPKGQSDITDVKDDVLCLLKNAGISMTAIEMYATFVRKVSIDDFHEAMTDLQMAGRVVNQDGKYKLR